MQRPSSSAIPLALFSCLVWGCAAPATTSEATAPPAAGAETGSGPQETGANAVWGYLESTYDADGDGSVSAREYTRDPGQFALWDRDGDGRLRAADFEQPGGAQRRSGGGMSMGRGRRTLGRYSQVGEGTEQEDGLAVQQGEPAPDFTLSSPDGTDTVHLADFRGDRPVALIFGSYT